MSRTALKFFSESWVYKSIKRNFLFYSFHSYFVSLQYLPTCFFANYRCNLHSHETLKKHGLKAKVSTNPEISWFVNLASPSSHQPHHAPFDTCLPSSPPGDAIIGPSSTTLHNLQTAAVDHHQTLNNPMLSTTPTSLDSPPLTSKDARVFQVHYVSP